MLKEFLKKILNREPTDEELKSLADAAANEEKEKEPEKAVEEKKKTEDFRKIMPETDANKEQFQTLYEHLKQLTASNQRLIEENESAKKIMQANEEKAFLKRIDEKIAEMKKNKQLPADDKDLDEQYRKMLKFDFEGTNKLIEKMPAIGAVQKNEDGASQNQPKPRSYEELRANALAEIKSNMNLN